MNANKREHGLKKSNASTVLAEPNGVQHRALQNAVYGITNIVLQCLSDWLLLFGFGAFGEGAVSAAWPMSSRTPNYLWPQNSTGRPGAPATRKQPGMLPR